MTVYYTKLDTTDFDLENQLMLEAQVKYALAQDCTHLIDSNDYLFEITTDGDEITLNELDQSNSDNEEECTDCGKELSTSEIIDKILRNSLLSTEPIRKEQAETMLILAELKHVLANL